MNYKNKMPLFGGLIAAILSTACCIVPLALLLLGVGGSWIANLTALEPYKPYLIAISVILLVFAYQQIFTQDKDCEKDMVCAVPENQKKYKVIFWIATIIILSSSTISIWAPLFY